MELPINDVVEQIKQFNNRCFEIKCLKRIHSTSYKVKEQELIKDIYNFLLINENYLSQNTKDAIRSLVLKLE